MLFRSDKSLANMSNQLRDDCGYDNAWGDNPYGVAQMLMALTELGIDPLSSESGFTRADNSMISYLYSIQKDDGGFGAGETTDKFLTPQAFSSLVSYFRYVNKKTSMYDMTDVTSDEDYQNIVDLIKENLIKIDKIEYISLDNKDIIDKVSMEYASLNDEYKGQIDGNKIIEYQNKIIELNTIVEDLNNDIWNKINPSNITIDDKEDVLDIISRYEKLSKEDRTYIKGYDEVLEALDIIENIGKLEMDNKSLVKTGDNNIYIAIIMQLAFFVCIITMKNKKEA